MQRDRLCEIVEGAPLLLYSSTTTTPELPLIQYYLYSSTTTTLVLPPIQYYQLCKGFRAFKCNPQQQEPLFNAT